MGAGGPKGISKACDGAGGNVGAQEPGPSLPSPGRKLSEREAVLQALGDPLSRELLLLLSKSPAPAKDLLRSIEVPQSTLYRRLVELREQGLVDVQRSIITEDGKKMELYRSLLAEVEVRLNGQGLSVRTKRRDLAAERLSDLWGEVRAGGRP